MRRLRCARLLAGPHSHIFVVEYAPNGRLLKVAIANGAVTTVASELDHPIGLALALDEQSAYVTEQAPPADGCAASTSVPVSRPTWSAA